MMSEVNRQLSDTHTLCPQCGVMFPIRFLACPACIGFAKKRERWVAPSKRRPRREPTQDQTRLDGSEEYPA